MGKRMTKHLAGLALLVLLAGLCVPALAGNTLMNVYIEKETLNEEEAAQKAICSKNGELRVTRQSVYPWDEEGSRWSVFVELENTSDGPIVMDETWLYLQGRQGDDGHVAFSADRRRVLPHGRALLPGRAGDPVCGIGACVCVAV